MTLLGVVRDTTLLDIYRLVLLVEVVFVMALYSWSIWHYIRGARCAGSEVLHDMRIGQASRVIAVWLTMLLFALSIVERFGSTDNGRIISNVVLQIICWAAVLAWGHLDFVRFRRGGNDKDTTLLISHVEAAEIAGRQRARVSDETMRMLAEHEAATAARERRRIVLEHQQGKT